MRQIEPHCILLMSEDLDEILNLSDRVAVIFKGEIMEHDPTAHDRRIAEVQASGGASGGRGRK